MIVLISGCKDKPVACDWLQKSTCGRRLSGRLFHVLVFMQGTKRVLYSKGIEQARAFNTFICNLWRGIQTAMGVLHGSQLFALLQRITDCLWRTNQLSSRVDARRLLVLVIVCVVSSSCLFGMDFHAIRIYLTTFKEHGDVCSAADARLIEHPNIRRACVHCSAVSTSKVCRESNTGAVGAQRILTFAAVVTQSVSSGLCLL